MKIVNGVTGAVTTDANFVADWDMTKSVPEFISFRQMLIGLENEGWITSTQGESWLAGTLPAPVVTLISTLPANQRFAAIASATRASIIERSNALVNDLATAENKSSAEIDQFFIDYKAV